MASSQEDVARAAESTIAQLEALRDQSSRRARQGWFVYAVWIAMGVLLMTVVVLVAVREVRHVHQQLHDANMRAATLENELRDQEQRSQKLDGQLEGEERRLRNVEEIHVVRLQKQIQALQGQVGTLDDAKADRQLVQQLSSALDGKASNTDVTALGAQVSQLRASMATSASVDAVTSSVDNLRSTISSVQHDVSTRALSSDVSSLKQDLLKKDAALEDRISTLEKAVAQASAPPPQVPKPK